MRRMTYGQGEPPPGWDPFKPRSQQRAEQAQQSGQPARPADPWASTADPGNGDTPDWAALADQTESRAKRRRLLHIGVGVLATVVVAGVVAAVVVTANGKSDPTDDPSGQASGSDIPSGSGAQAPSFEPTTAPPPLDPKDFVSSARKDTAPLGAGTLFPGSTVTLGQAVYRKGPVADTTDCASAAQGTLKNVLAKNHCTRLIRVTYTRNDVVVTVGVAVFDSASQATTARKQSDTKSIVKPLSGSGVKPFCDGPVCRNTTNSFGRYTYFTLAGHTGGKDVTEKDTAVFTAGDDLADFTYRQIHQRGEAQASAAATGG